MRDGYWLKQVTGNPAYPDILWSRPENKMTAGKLLIVGGNAHGFAAVGQAYGAALDAGVGVARAVLPNVLQKMVSKLLDECVFLASNPSGGFAKQALHELLAEAEWSDAVMLAGDFGRNSETGVMLESFVEKYSGPLIITKDAMDYFAVHSAALLRRPTTMLVLTLPQLQKTAVNAKFTQAFTLGSTLVRLAETLRDFSTEYQQVILVTRYEDRTVVAFDGHVSSTVVGEPTDIWRIPTAARAGVFWLQNPAKPFEAVTTALYQSET